MRHTSSKVVIATIATAALLGLSGGLRAEPYPGAAALAPPAADAAPAPSRAPPNTPVVQLGDKDRPFCTAFYIGSGGVDGGGSPDLLVSAGHCFFETATPVTGFSAQAQGSTPRFDVVLVEAGSPEGGMDDFSLLRIQNAIPSGWKPETLDCKYIAHVGDLLHTAGFPGAQAGAETFSEGYVNGLARPFFGGDGGWSQPVIPVTMPVSGGQSGSPVYELDGRVIGILVGTNAAQPGWSYVQPLTPVCQALHISP